WWRPYPLNPARLHLGSKGAKIIEEEGWVYVDGLPCGNRNNGILAGNLFPSFAAAREKGRPTRLLRHIKAIRHGLKMESQEFDETGCGLWEKDNLDIGGNIIDPNYHAVFTGVNWGAYWPDLLFPYVKAGKDGVGSARTKNNRGVFACPTLNNFMIDYAWGGA